MKELPDFFELMNARLGRRVKLDYGERGKPTATLIGRLLAFDRVKGEGLGLRVLLRQGTWEPKPKGEHLDAQRDWKEDPRTTEFFLGPFATISHTATYTYAGDPDSTREEADEVLEDHNTDVWTLASKAGTRPFRTLRITMLA